MKKGNSILNIPLWILGSFLIFLTGCPNPDSLNGEETLTDPPGTITISINYTANAKPIALYSGLAGDGPYLINGYTYPYININAGMDASLNFVYHTSVVQNNSGSTVNPIWLGLGSFGCEVANVGKVSGLGSIVSKPTAGWANTCAVQVGNGYVMRYKKSRDIASPSLPYIYVRIYVVNWLKDISGGAIGANMKYEPSF